MIVVLKTSKFTIQSGAQCSAQFVARKFFLAFLYTRTSEAVHEIYKKNFHNIVSTQEWWHLLQLMNLIEINKERNVDNALTVVMALNKRTAGSY